ncbi:hypothetical protein O1611_g6368 [Lasiodiplodia mahajangana]|uniref:Uncharacterized protein n=1 Tax=Lasiodiplodia mahajangana TaxID=1108764 RepID=A0ACC2JIK3_9PEZI|nr:hypothetical protein O1611_g6368 [Lasiodiplodia mahajangana]
MEAQPSKETRYDIDPDPASSSDLDEEEVTIVRVTPVKWRVTTRATSPISISSSSSPSPSPGNPVSQEDIDEKPPITSLAPDSDEEDLATLLRKPRKSRGVQDKPYQSHSSSHLLLRRKDRKRPRPSDSEGKAGTQKTRAPALITFTVKGNKHVAPNPAPKIPSSNNTRNHELPNTGKSRSEAPKPSTHRVAPPVAKKRRLDSPNPAATLYYSNRNRQEYLKGNDTERISITQRAKNQTTDSNTSPRNGIAASQDDRHDSSGSKFGQTGSRAHSNVATAQRTKTHTEQSTAGQKPKSQTKNPQTSKTNRLAPFRQANKKFSDNYDDSCLPDSDIPEEETRPKIST